MFNNIKIPDIDEKNIVVNALNVEINSILVLSSGLAFTNTLEIGKNSKTLDRRLFIIFQ